MTDDMRKTMATDDIRRNMATIDASVASLDPAAFEALTLSCEAALKAGDKVVVTGLGKNVPVCDKFVGTMLSFGLEAAFMNTNSAVHGDLGMVNDGDVVIILTKSGQTAESVYLNELLKERRCERWLLTFTEGTELAANVDGTVTLELAHEGDQWNIAPNNSTIVNLIVLQALAVELSRRMGVTLDDFRRNHPGGHIGRQLAHE